MSGPNTVSVPGKINLKPWLWFLGILALTFVISATVAIYGHHSKNSAATNQPAVALRGTVVNQSSVTSEQPSQIICPAATVWATHCTYDGNYTAGITAAVAGMHLSFDHPCGPKADCTLQRWDASGQMAGWRDWVVTDPTVDGVTLFRFKGNRGGGELVTSTYCLVDDVAATICPTPPTIPVPDNS